MSNLNIAIGKLKLKNPVILASGTYDKVISNIIDVKKLGALTSKTLTFKPREGNPLPRIIKTKYGFLNSNGWRNPGIKKFLRDDLPFWHNLGAEIIPSIGGFSVKDYTDLAKILNNQDINAIEVCVSCPNVSHGLTFGSDTKALASLVKEIRKNFDRTLIIKLGPNVTEILPIAKAAILSGADALCLTNTFLGLEVDSSKRKTKLPLGLGGYSGPAIKPMALHLVWQVYQSLKCPIIGGGGIAGFDDALDFLMCGATAVFLGSANLTNPRLSIKIVNGLENYVKNQKLKSLKSIRGVIKCH